MSKNKIIFTSLGWLITIILPFIILMLSIRIMITPLFARIEYQMPGFPDDQYGFTIRDRLEWSEPSIKYLVNRSDISFLEDLSFDNGDPIYNARELSHMEDVKNLVTAMRYGLAGGMLLLLLLTIFLVVFGEKADVRDSYRRGGWGVFFLIGTILLFVALSFNQLFTWFHQLFFQSGTWTFYTSDTLIRLFPMRFWRDAFIFVGLLSMVIASLLIIINRRKHKLDKR